MNRILLTLASVSTAFLGYALWLGFSIENARSLDPQQQAAVSFHVLVAVGTLILAGLVHALCLTYFMGTGRWIEETTRAYHLSNSWHRENQSLKYRTLPPMVFALAMLLATGAFGGAADPAAGTGFQGLWGVSAATLHMLVACTTVTLNLLVNLTEYSAILRNGQLIEEILQDVMRIRAEHGLSNEPAHAAEHLGQPSGS